MFQPQPPPPPPLIGVSSSPRKVSSQASSPETSGDTHLPPDASEFSSTQEPLSSLGSKASSKDVSTDSLKVQAIRPAPPPPRSTLDSSNTDLRPALSNAQTPNGTTAPRSEEEEKDLNWSFHSNEAKQEQGGTTLVSQSTLPDSGKFSTDNPGMQATSAAEIFVERAKEECSDKENTQYSSPLNTFSFEFNKVQAALLLELNSLLQSEEPAQGKNTTTNSTSQEIPLITRSSLSKIVQSEPQLARDLFLQLLQASEKFLHFCALPSSQLQGGLAVDANNPLLCQQQLTTETPISSETGSPIFSNVKRGEFLPERNPRSSITSPFFSPMRRLTTAVFAQRDQSRSSVVGFKNPLQRQSVVFNRSRGLSCVSMPGFGPVIMTRALEYQEGDQGSINSSAAGSQLLYDEGEETTVNQFSILSTLGVGSQGEVLLGYDNDQGEFRALKKLKRGLTGSAATKALKEEVSIMSRLRHENIVTLHEVIDDPHHKYIYLVMQYVDQGPLVRWVDEGVKGQCQPIDSQRLQYIARQMTAGLSYLHQRQIFHRDIKPDNILLGQDDRVYLGDFGMAHRGDKSMSESRMFRSLCGASFQGESGSQQFNPTAGGVATAIGTPAYFAPELLIQRGEDDEELDLEAVDVWALGVSLYQLLLGKLPFAVTEAQQLQYDPRGAACQIESQESSDPTMGCGLSENALLGYPEPWHVYLKALCVDPPLYLSDLWMTSSESENKQQVGENSGAVVSPPNEVPPEWRPVLRGMLMKNPTDRWPLSRVRSAIKQMQIVVSSTYESSPSRFVNKLRAHSEQTK